MQSNNMPDATVRGLRALALVGLTGLIVLGLAWELWLAPTGSGTLALKVVPLMFCLVGLLRHRMYTYRWLSLLVWLYFTEGVVRAWSDQGLSQVLAGLEVALCLLLFAASALYVHRRLKTAKAAGLMPDTSKPAAGTA
ncbi:MAG: DUF2069 domain-containing protein [Rubrivivax sp.]|jgi:uncharacterized membrane protein|nr:DUF2069 domain-containing protein [Rubrivivax sp.]